MKKVKEFVYVCMICIPLAVAIYLLASAGILIFNLIKFYKHENRKNE